MVNTKSTNLLITCPSNWDGCYPDKIPENVTEHEDWTSFLCLERIQTHCECYVPKFSSTPRLLLNQ